MSHEDMKLRRALACYSRNFRWGTCAACPRDNNKDWSIDAARPEDCENTDRSDHQLTAKGLCETILRHHRDRSNNE